MNEILSLMIGVMMFTSNQTTFTATTTGEYYEVGTQMYSNINNTTYVLFNRYYVQSDGAGTIRLHFQVRPYLGKPTKEQLTKDAQERSDNGITAIGK